MNFSGMGICPSISVCESIFLKKPSIHYPIKKNEILKYFSGIILVRY